MRHLSISFLLLLGSLVLLFFIEWKLAVVVLLAAPLAILVSNAVGKRVSGKVVSIVDYGAFVVLEEGVEGLIHVSEMSWTKRISHPSELLEKGQEVTVDVENGKVTTPAGTFDFPPLPAAVIGIFEDGGLIPHTRKALGID